MTKRQRKSSALLLILFAVGCTTEPAKSPDTSPTSCGSNSRGCAGDCRRTDCHDGSWGNTEGAAIDSKGNLYFCSRGTYKGIVRWNEKDGAQRYLAVAAKAGPGGLWIDERDNIFLTATDERRILKVTPGKR